MSQQTASIADLHVALEGALCQHFGAPRRIIELERRPSALRSSSVIDELDLLLDDGTTLQLIFKDVSRHGVLEGARQAKPAFLYNPLREIETYRTILAPSGLGTATCYGAVVDEQAERYWLFIERVPGLELYRVALPTWQHTAGWLAVFHTRFREIGRSDQAQCAHLLRYDGDFYRMWMRRAKTFASQAPLSQQEAARSQIEWLAERYDQVVERLVALPTTLIHGEFYASNVLVQETAGELRVCPVDWEMAAIGPGLIDLAALTAGSWTGQERDAMALTYHAALAPDSGWPLEAEVFLTALDCCRLHMAVQWLGWSPSWSPPPEHTQNWLGEAIGLAEMLGL